MNSLFYGLVVIQYKDGVEIARYASQRQLIKQTGFSQGLVSAVLNGKKKHHRGYTFKYENEVVGNIHDDPGLLKNKNKHFIPGQISLCKNCWCMAHTINNKCGKCGANKEK